MSAKNSAWPKIKTRHGTIPKCNISYYKLYQNSNISLTILKYLFGDTLTNTHKLKHICSKWCTISPHVCNAIQMSMWFSLMKFHLIQFEADWSITLLFLHIVGWEPNGRYRNILCTAIVPFWFSTDDILFLARLKPRSYHILSRKSHFRPFLWKWVGHGYLVVVKGSLWLLRGRCPALFLCENHLEWLLWEMYVKVWLWHKFKLAASLPALAGQ